MRAIKLTHEGKVKTMKEIKSEYLHRILKAASYNQEKAAELSGLTVTTIRNFFKENYETETIVNRKEGENV